MDTNKEELIFRKHMEELAKSAYFKNTCIYTDFLNLNEQSIVKSMERQLSPVAYSLYGGCDGAERVMLCFHGEQESSHCHEIAAEEYRSEYPVCCVKIVPANARFAEKLTHRDYLGAILNLGIDRCKTGDIILKDDAAYLFCDTLIGAFICDTLDRIRHTTVKASLSSAEEQIQERSFEVIHASVASLRLDAVISAAFRASRSSLSNLVLGGKVFVNGREILSNSHPVKPGDTISVRGYGKFILKEQGTLTKKGKTNITIEKYV
ncbi:MAG: RNA-binding protein [Lachnospiraceae bacterium]|nr:RNA-binding protein [Lachnospiraceae bacterium]